MNTVITPKNNQRYVREWCYIFNSKIDFCDLWLSLLFIALGLQMVSVDPIDKAWYYEPAADFGLNSFLSGLSFLGLGIR